MREHPRPKGLLVLLLPSLAGVLLLGGWSFFLVRARLVEAYGSEPELNPRVTGMLGVGVMGDYIRGFHEGVLVHPACCHPGAGFILVAERAFHWLRRLRSASDSRLGTGKVRRAILCDLGRTVALLYWIVEREPGMNWKSG